MPLLSVIIPTFNSAKYLSEALQSVFSQTFEDFEVIVVDDGSTDNTADIVKEYGNSLRYIRQKNQGPSAARNLGIRRAEGKYIAFLDADDWWNQNHLTELLECCELTPDAGLVYGGRKWVDEKGELMRDTPIPTICPEGWIFGDLFRRNYIATPSVLVRRSVLTNVGGFNECLSNFEDYDLWLRISARYCIAFAKDVFFYQRRHKRNLTLNTYGRAKGSLLMFNNASSMIRCGEVNANNHPEIINVKKRIKEIYRDASSALFSIGKYDEVTKLGFEAMRKNYLSFDLLIRWMVSMLPEIVVAWMHKLYRHTGELKKE